MSRWTHLDETGAARMVDVTEKPITDRVATARGCVFAATETLRAIREGAVVKGNVLEVARLAGILAAKKTDELIPLCHPLPLTGVRLDLEVDMERGCVQIEAQVRTAGRTGVEMEALTAVSVAALTVYDMCKSADKGMTIGEIRLIYKEGGRSGRYVRPGEA